MFYDASRRRWVGQIDLDRDPVTGKRRRPKVSAATEAGCRVKLARLRKRLKPSRYGRPVAHDPVVYFARMGNRVKIGWTTNLKRRMSALALPMSAVAHLVDGGPAEEAELHRLFAASRIGRSEWFEITPGLTAVMALSVRADAMADDADMEAV